MHVAAALCLLTLVSGCGGGGSASSDLGYTGSTSAATLTATNSSSLLGGAFTGGNSGIIISGVTAGLTHYDFGASRRPRTLVLADALIKFARHSFVDDTLARPETAATLTNIPSSSLNGNCGGTATVNGSYDDVSKLISISAIFNNYCQDGTTLNGTVGASGLAVADSQNNISISSITITLAKLSAQYGGDSFTADGTMSIAPQAGFSYIDNDVVITIDMLLKDNATTKVYKLENFRIAQSSNTGTPSYEDLTINGRYYDPDEGYLDLSTPTTLRIINNDQWPSSGSLRGAGNNSSATITAQSNTTYQLDVDTDGNGSVDSTESGLWVNI
jgi:hypothetical protein